MGLGNRRALDDPLARVLDWPSTLCIPQALVSDGPHSNENLPAAVDVETTGKGPFYHDVIQIAVVPLDSSSRMYLCD